MLPLVVHVVLVLFLAGVALYVISLGTLDPTIMALIRVVVIVAAVLYVLGLFVPGMSVLRLR